MLDWSFIKFLTHDKICFKKIENIIRSTLFPFCWPLYKQGAPAVIRVLIISMNTLPANIYVANPGTKVMCNIKRFHHFTYALPVAIME